MFKPHKIGYIFNVRNCSQQGGNTGMNEKKVVVYISEDSSKCDQLLFELDKLAVNYETKNVTNNKNFMNELQNEGVYGTPATFIGNNKNPILGRSEEHTSELQSRGH